MPRKSSGRLVIAITLLLSICLTVAPFPNDFSLVAPHWVILTLLYWSATLPHKVNVGTGWVTGILVDVLTNSLLGHNALIYSLVAYSGHAFYKRIKNYHIWQQASLLVFFFLIIQFVDFCLTQFSRAVDLTLLFWAPALTSALFWPLLFSVFRYTRRKYQID